MNTPNFINRYTYLVTEIQGCYVRADIPHGWCLKYQITGTIQHLMDSPKTREILTLMRNFLRLEAELSTFLYLMIDREMPNYPLDCTIPRPAVLARR